MDCVFQFFVTNVDGIQTLSCIAHARLKIHGLAILLLHVLFQCPENRWAASDGIVVAVGKYNAQAAVAAGLQHRIAKAWPDRTALLPDNLSPVLTDQV